jgi:hypothetical protein
MNKFQSLISTGNEVLSRRAGNLATTAEIAQQTLINNLKVEKAQLEAKLMNLTDLAPESSVSLRPGAEGWNATTWAAELQSVKEKLYSVSIKIKLAEETFNEYFTEIKNEGK